MSNISQRNFNARWYDPALGRFAQADSIIPPGVQGLDRYAYVNNSPLNYTDPSGHICVESDGDSDAGLAGNCHGGSNPNYKGGLQGSPSGWIWSKKPEKIDLKFDPFNGPYLIDLENGNLSLEQLANINEVWNSASDAYIINGFDLDEIAANTELNPLTFDDMYEVLSVPADLETLMVDRSTYKPYVYFLSFLSESLDKNLLPTGSGQNYMQFEPNYMNALMVSYPSVLNEAKRSYQEDFADEFMTDYGGDLFEEFLEKIRIFKPSVP